MNPTSKKFYGIKANSGFAIGKIFIIKPQVFSFEKLRNKTTHEEINKINHAIAQTVAKLKTIYQIAVKKIGKKDSEIFQAHIQIAQDPLIIENATKLIKTNNYSAGYALQQVIQETCAMFANMNNEYFKARASDMQDVGNRLLGFIANQPVKDIVTVKEKVVIVAYDLTPSQTIQINDEFIKGFACEIGGKTSHTVIIAKTMGIPAVVGIKDLLNHVNPEMMCYLDGNEGMIGFNLQDREKKLFLKAVAKYQLLVTKIKKYETVANQTKDGHHLPLEINIGQATDLNYINQNMQFDGIGLFRTEFLYMQSPTAPNEETQLQVYKQVLQQMPNKPVVIRTLDIGGDKKISYLKQSPELNPFLGVRAIRFCFEHPELFKIQLRALLRASAFGNMMIMFPMIATVEEFLKAKAMLEQEQQNLQQQGIKVSSSLQIGMMLEIPSAVFNIEALALHADFFSVGTNDLMQYTMASDRMNQKLNHLYQELNPGFLKQLKMAVDGAHKLNKPIAICGEMASSLDALPFLIGMKIDILSVSVSKVQKVKYYCHKWNVKTCEQLLATALTLSTEKEVKSLLKKAKNY